jgi:hypothetical protein
MSRRTAVAVVLWILAAGAPASAATLATDARCYVEQEPLGILGTGWSPGSSFGVSGASISATGFADATGDWAAEAAAPNIGLAGIKPKTFTLDGTQDGVSVARTTFKVVRFLVEPKRFNGKAARLTTWRLSGFLPGRRIFFHVRRGRQVYTQNVGRGDAPCGTLKTKLPQVPVVPAGQLVDGRYKLFVDNRRAFRVGGRQYRATITVD